ncbi:uncharacterized protein LOC143064229 isoform X4 [Mytilus galloprovincialis]|uniref:uncharacterized protein LOC143064229 isoform X4 n=1 Tax=Mytilus galloprovincialis TaxID=29158 RepID=UPI003F7C78EF
MMWDLQRTKEFMEDETTCGPLCQHPSCWSSSNRKIKGIPHYAPRIPSPDSIETDLPTVKVYNMLGEYGDDEKDLYPAKHYGKPAHTRKSSLPLVKDGMTKSASSGFKPKAPAGTPISVDTKSRTVKKPVKVVEVQEVFDVDDLNSTWDNAFVPKQCLVWVPNPNYKRKVTQDQMASINQLSQGSKPKLLLKDITGDMLPTDLDYDQMSFTRKESHYSFISDRRRGRSPPPSSRMITPYSRGTLNYRSQGGRRPQFIFDMEGLDELLELPREILIQVLDNAKPSDFTSREAMHELIEKFFPSFDRGISNLTSTSVELLQQKKMNIHEGKSRNLRTGHLIETKPVFHLDEDGVEQPKHIVDAISERSHQPLDSEYVESIRDLYINRKREYNQKKPLPPIGHDQQLVKKKKPKKVKNQKTKLASISLGLPELPTGVKHTKSFTYNKKNYQHVDLTIAPVPTPPVSVRESESQASEHGTTVRVNIPSVESERKEALHDEAGSTDTPHSSRSGREAAPMHTVSPALSTKVPHAPATTPATHQTPTGTFSRDTTMRSNVQTRGDTREGVSSPTQNIRAPTNSPRLSPEPTGGLDTIKEAQHEGGMDSAHPVSRGGRSVRFSQDVPEVPAPPSSPDREIEGPRSSVTTPMEQPETPKPTSGHTIRSNKSTVNSSVKENSELELKPIVSRLKDPSTVSTPEPWPSVNEADYDMTPSGTNAGLHESSQNTHSSSVNLDSRLALGDPSSRNYTTANSTVRSEASSGTSLTSRNASTKGESPAPPPPSPESKDKKQDNPKSGRKRELLSRESSMAPVIEEKDEEHEDTHVRTLVVEVPPLGQPTEKPKEKNHRTTDTFINIDIPAMTMDELSMEKSRSDVSHMTEIIERPGTEENESSGGTMDGHTINTRDAVLSVQTTSEGEPNTLDPDSQSNMDSAGVTPSMGANESPTSTIPENKLKMEDLKFMDQAADDNDDKDDKETKNETDDKDEKDLEMTEEGGDHAGFKHELQEELEKLSQKDSREDNAE